MESIQQQEAPSKLIKDFVLARQQLGEVQRAHAQTHIALHQSCLRILNEVFDELRTDYDQSVTKHAEWCIIDIEEYLGKIIVIVRFATKKDASFISSGAKIKLTDLYQEILQKATKRFVELDNAFVTRPIFA